MEAMQGYRECFEVMMSIPKKELVHLNIPIEVATAEAASLSIAASQDRETLIESGIDPLLVDTLPARAGALTYTAARYTFLIETDPEATRQWKEESQKGYDLQRNLLRQFAFAYRKDDELSKSVAKIREGKGHKDMVLDLLALFLLGTEHPEPLDRMPRFDKAQLTQAKVLHTTLTELLARMSVDPKKVDAAKAELSYAYTYYRKAADEVKDHGQFVFEGTERYRLYVSEYHSDMGKRGGKTNPEVEPAPAPPPSPAPAPKS